MQHIALEGRCFVLGCNQFNKYSDFPQGFIEPEFNPSRADDIAGKEVFCRGGSLIVNPLGEIIAGPHFDGETILYADLDLDDIPRAKMDFDAVGHYARPDIFTLHVNEAPNQSVVQHTHPTTQQGCQGHGHQHHHHHHHSDCGGTRVSNNNATED